MAKFFGKYGYLLDRFRNILIVLGLYAVIPTHPGSGWWDQALLGKEVPFLSSRVTDEVGVLSGPVFQELETRLDVHEQSTGNQVAVLIVSDLEGEVLEEYSLKVVETWKLGQKGKDNGVLLLIAINDRKLRIEVGYGLEGVLTDAYCSQIIRNEITPYFKAKDYEKGISGGVSAILHILDGGDYFSFRSDGSPEGGEENGKMGAREVWDEYRTVAHSVDEADIPILFRLFFGIVFFIVITPFTMLTIFMPYMGWFLFFFLIPFYATFPLVIFGGYGVFLLFAYLTIVAPLKLWFLLTKRGKEFRTEYGGAWAQTASGGSGGGGSSSGWSSRSSSGGFSGGGGSFGGGGSSGSW